MLLSTRPGQRFRVFKQFNELEGPLPVKLKRRLDKRTAALLQARGRTQTVLQTLAETPCIKLKEVLESFEIHAVARKRLVNSHLVDLCCGHGLTGLLFAIFDPGISRVTLLDREFSKSSGLILERLTSAFPDLQGRVVRRRLDLSDFEVPSGDVALLAVHACGPRTDQCLDLALRHRSPIAMVPCCYTGTGKNDPYTLKAALGVPLSADVGRTYKLHHHDYDVQWERISSLITPMNRVMLAHPRGTSPALKGSGRSHA